MIFVIGFGESEPSNSRRLTGSILVVGNARDCTKRVSIKLSVEPESSKEINLSIHIHEVSESLEQESDTERTIKIRKSRHVEYYVPWKSKNLVNATIALYQGTRVVDYFSGSSRMVGRLEATSLI